MKITCITIKLEPVEGETSKATELIRDGNKLWFAIDSETQKTRTGLFPGEINLINNINHDIINVFNNNNTMRKKDA